ncbi:hypothetical protein HOF65_02470 [bacterium]|nr:hypothetical protein [bacterium]MBT3852865.1 hypothetical protein [bacterium]MBT4632463.1 hypothetical protein [bacterium]MBT6779566.1 hypothetical protein [bacterium]
MLTLKALTGLFLVVFFFLSNLSSSSFSAAPLLESSSHSNHTLFIKS